MTRIACVLAVVLAVAGHARAQGEPAPVAPPADGDADGEPAPPAADPTTGELAPADPAATAPEAVAPPIEPAVEPDVEPTAAPATRPTELVVNRGLSAGFVIVGAAAWVSSDRLWQDVLSPRHCRVFCEPGGVNAFDREVGDALKWSDDSVPQIISDLSGYVVVPLIGFGGLTLAAWKAHELRANWLDDMLLVAEATVVAGLVNRASALGMGRTRPRTLARSPDDPAVLADRQAYESFFSGHTSVALSIGISAAMVASLRHYPYAKWLWGGAIGFGLMTGYMRLAGADHYTTDVIAGAVVGTAVGIGIPYLHRRRGPRIEAAPLRDGATVSLSGAW